MQALCTEPFDILVIGGGITGASIFRDAALRGMRVALVESNDFASGTSSRSSKLIHGGLRYIRNLGLCLAWESCHERNLHVRLNKRLVRPVPFLVPIYKGRGTSKGVLRMGMWMYEILSGFENHRLHKFLNREQTLSIAPGIPSQDLTGGCLYYDAVISDSRWTVEIVKDGVRNGGLAINHARVTDLLKAEGKIIGVRIRDSLTGRSYEIQGRVTVNATGVFADEIRRMDDPASAGLLRLSKGTHLVFAQDDVPLTVTTVFASPIDNRPLFLVKREGCFLYGTSDDWQDADPSAPLPEKKDVEYLIRSLDLFLPEAALNRDRVQFVYSGFRPLLNSGSQDPSAATREDLIEMGGSGLITVIGGKLTTARLMAIRVLDRVIARIGMKPEWKKCRTDELSIGGTNEAVAESLAYWVKRCPPMMGYFRILFQRYGLDADEICKEVARIYFAQDADPRTEPIRAEVEYVCRNEMVCTLQDLIERRAGFLFWNAEKRLERLRYGEQVIAEELGVTSTEFESQFADYERYLRRFHRLP